MRGQRGERGLRDQVAAIDGHHRVDGLRRLGQYRDGEGKQKSAGTFGTKREALKAARLGEAGHAPAKTQYPVAVKVRGKLTVAGCSDEWLPNHPLSPHAREVCTQVIRKHVIAALGARALADVTAADIRAWFRQLEAQGVSQALGNKVKTVTSAMMQTAAEDGKIPFNPVRGVKFKAVPPKRRRALTLDEWLRVRRYLTGEYLLLCDLVMATGCRIEEARGMEAEDIERGRWHICRVRNELKTGFVTVDTTKTHKDRYVPVRSELARRIAERGPGRAFSDFKMDTFRIRKWHPACKAAGLDWQPAPRDLRRTFATIARSRGADLEAVRVALGTHQALDDRHLPG